MLQQNENKKKPSWIKVKAPSSKQWRETRDAISHLGLNTVCEEAACPNIAECWSKKHATVIILGSVCTRACSFCNIKTGKPDKVDPHEPYKISMAVKNLCLKHIVITSVDRDDLEDGGASHFAKCIGAIRESSPKTTIEVLTPDFLRKEGSVEVIVDAKPDVYNHNLETVPRLYKSIRPGARYFNSLKLLHKVKKLDPLIFTKSGLMLGIGETNDEVIQVMDDLIEARVDFLTMGQYLQPTQKNARVDRFVTPEEFAYLGRVAQTKGFLLVASSPLTRSSYHAEEDFKAMKNMREKAQI